MKKLLLVLLLVPMVSLGQNKSGLELCLFLQQAAPQFESNSTSQAALDKILNVNGLKGEYVLVSCDQIENVVAMTYNGIRYILYDKAFMRSLESDPNVANLSILAHELGHHVFGHSKDIIAVINGDIQPKSLEKQRSQELEADEFAGSTMSKLGYSLKSVISVYSKLSSNKDDQYSTHPSLNKRISALSIGYESNEKLFNKRIENKNQELVSNPTIFYLKISDLYRQKKFQEAQMLAFDATLKNPNNSTFYYLRAKSIYSDLNEIVNIDEALELIVELYDKAIEIDPDYFAFYYWRGSAKYYLNDLDGSVLDFNKSLNLKSQYRGEEDSFSQEEENIYAIRGQSQFKLRNLQEARNDLTKALEFGFSGLINPVSKENNLSIYQMLGLIQYKLGNFEDASENIEKDIKLNPKNNYSHWVRAILIGNKGNYNDFVQAYKIYLHKLDDPNDFARESLAFIRFKLSRFTAGSSNNDELKDLEKKYKKPNYTDEWYKKQVLEIEHDFTEVIERSNNDESYRNMQYLSIAYRELIFLLLSSKDYDKALFYAEKALLVAGKYQEEHFILRSMMYAEESELENIKDEGLFFKKDAYNNLGYINRESGNPKLAIEYYSKGIAIYPEFSKFWGGRGTAKSYLKDMIGACEDWNKAVQLEGGESYQSKINEFCQTNYSRESKTNTKQKAIEELKDLKELLELELITQEEFDKKSKELKKIILEN